MECAPAGQQLQWLRHRDEMTRGKAIVLARSGMPFGEARKAAMHVCKVEWCLADGFSARRNREHSRERSRTPRRESRRTEDGGSSQKQQRQFATTMAGGILLCPDYPIGKCKSEKQCLLKQRHACDVVKPEGGACGCNHIRTKCLHYRA